MVESLLKSTKEFLIQGVKLTIRMATESRNKDMKDQKGFKAIQTEQKSFAQVVREGAKEDQGKDYRQDDRGEKKVKRQIDWITRSIVGVTRSLEHLQNLQSEGLPALGECTIKYLGGLNVLITVSNKDVMGSCFGINGCLMENWFSEWFQCPEDYCCKERLAVVEIRGIPIKAWNDLFFRSIGNCFGKFAGLSKETTLLSRLDKAKVVVVLKDSFKIPNSIVVDDGNEEFKVRTHVWKWVEDVEDEEFVTAIIADKDDTGIVAGSVHRTTHSGEINASTRHEDDSEENEVLRTRNSNDVHANDCELMMVSNDVSKGEFREDVVKAVEMGLQNNSKTQTMEESPEACKMLNEAHKIETHLLGHGEAHQEGEAQVLNGANLLSQNGEAHLLGLYGETQMSNSQANMLGHNGAGHQRGQQPDDMPKSIRNISEDSHLCCTVCVPETQNEVNISQQNRAEERGENSELQIDERDREKRMVVYCEERVGPKEIPFNGAPLQNGETSLEEMIRREIKTMIGEGNEMGLRFRQQGDSLEMDLQSVLSRLDRRF